MEMEVKEAYEKIGLMDYVLAESHQVMNMKDDVHKDLMREFQNSKMVNAMLESKLQSLQSKLVFPLPFVPKVCICAT